MKVRSIHGRPSQRHKAAHPSGIAADHLRRPAARIHGFTDQTILAGALPTISHEFGDIHTLPWLITAYLIASTAVTPLYGKISDIRGRCFTLRIAITLYLAGSLSVRAGAEHVCSHSWAHLARPGRRRADVGGDDCPRRYRRPQARGECSAYSP